MRRNLNAMVVPGAMFGHLEVVRRLTWEEQMAHGKTRSAFCICRLCGKEIVVFTEALGKGQKSCGCLRNYGNAQKNSPGVPTKGPMGTVIPGAKFGRLTVVERLRTNNRYTGKTKCICDCGAEVFPVTTNLTSGMSKSCGCYQRDVTIARNKDTAKFNGFSAKYPKTMNSWSSMVLRCTSPTWSAYERYGAKGVRVCQWLAETPWNLKELIGLRKTKKLSIDRVDNDGHYSCGYCEECKKEGWGFNVRWANKSEQMLNRGDFNVYLTAFGQTMTKSQWSKLSGIDDECIRRRIKRGWSVEKSLTTPDKAGNCYKPA